MCIRDSNKTTEWYVCLGVPYGTAYWQVGDSKEQNGSFNMAMTYAKRKLLDLKYQSCMNETIDKSDLMLLNNIVWNKLFLVLIRTGELLPIEDGGHIIVIFLPFHTSELQ